MQPTTPSITRYFLFLGFSLITTGCFRGLFSEAPRYLATEYVVDKPRIVALRSNPTMMVSGEPTQVDALLIAPIDNNIEGWNVSVCGLNPELDTRTLIWDLLCFEKNEAVTQLFTAPSLPYRLATPTFPMVSGCDNYEDTGVVDTGWVDEDNYPCAHYLPLMFEATVDGQPVYAAAFTNWFGESPSYLDQSNSYSNAGIELSIPNNALPGEEVRLEVTIAKNASNANFQWYIDAGTLKETGITRAHSYIPPTDEFLLPQTTSTNRLLIPDDYEGTLRVWIVIHEPWGSDLDMTWIEGQIEVNP